MTVPFLYMGMLIRFLLFLFSLISASDRTVGSSAVYRELPPGDFFTFTIPFSMKGSTDVSTACQQQQQESIRGSGHKRHASPLIIEISFLFLSFRDHPFHFPKNTRRR